MHFVRNMITESAAEKSAFLHIATMVSRRTGIITIFIHMKYIPAITLQTMPII